MKKELVKERNRVNQIMSEMKKVVAKGKSLNWPKVKVSKSHGTYQYHANNNYISKKQMDYIKALVKMEYYDRLIPNLELYVRKCDELIKMIDDKFLDQIYFNLCDGKKVLLQEALFIPLSEKIKQFEEEQIDRNQLPYEITSEIYTIKGEHVRSKSEKIIADELYRRNIPYKYEKPLILYDKGKQVVLYPDFTIMNKRTGKEYILEHFGMLDNKDYAKNALSKLNLYEKNGFLLGVNFLFLHETSLEPLNVKILNKYIEEYLT